MPLTTTIRRALDAFKRHNASRFGAALAFYIVFCVAPALLIAIAVAGAVIGRDVARKEILDRIHDSVGAAAGTAIAAMIQDAATLRVGWLATALGVLTLYFGLSGVYRQIDDALKTIWHDRADTPTRRPWNRLLSLMLVAGVGLVMLLSVGADAAIAAMGRYAATRLAGGELLWHGLQLVVSSLVLTALFAVVFRRLGSGRLEWRAAGSGAAVTAILFVAGKLALGVYLGKAAVGSAFGAAGSVVVVLLWSYWSAQIFFFGLEFTHVYGLGDDRPPAPLV